MRDDRHARARRPARGQQALSKNFNTAPRLALQELRSPIRDARDRARIASGNAAPRLQSENRRRRCYRRRQWSGETMPDVTLKTLSLQLVEFGKDVDGRLDSMDERFGAMDKRFDAIDQRFDTMDQRFDAMDRRFAAMDQRFDGIGQRFGAMDQRFDGVDRRLERIETKIDQLAEVRSRPPSPRLRRASPRRAPARRK